MNHGRICFAAALGLALAIAVNFAALAQTAGAATATQKCFADTDAKATIDDCTRAIALNPKDASAYANRCWGYNQIGNYTDAIADCAQAIALNKNDAIAYQQLGVAYAGQENYAAAVGNYTSAIILSPNDPTDYADRGLAYEGLGDKVGSFVDFQRALAKEPSNQLAQNGIKRLVPSYPLQITVPADANYADEKTDWNVPAQSNLQQNLATKTPTTAPGARTITTSQLADMLHRKEKLILVDALALTTHATIPGAKRLGFAGGFGTFDDGFDQMLEIALSKLTNGDLAYPLVTFCANSQCWEGYNAVLRAEAAGYKNIQWYRGGLDSWQAAKLPLLVSPDQFILW
jgi:PQQ-dependent catabolism-associated CXXCW motif protein